MTADTAVGSQPAAFIIYSTCYSSPWVGNVIIGGPLPHGPMNRRIVWVVCACVGAMSTFDVCQVSDVDTGDCESGVWLVSVAALMATSQHVTRPCSMKGSLHCTLILAG